MLFGWDELDDNLKMVSMVAFDIENIMSAHFHLGRLLDLLKNDLDTFNKAASFFSEALASMTYKVIVGTEKFFDKSKAGVIKILNKVIEQKNTNHRLYRYAKSKKDELENRFCELLGNLNYVRDKYFAHLDSEALSEDGRAAEIFDLISYDGIGELLAFAWDTLDGYFEIFDAKLPPKRQMVDDLAKLFDGGMK